MKNFVLFILLSVSLTFCSPVKKTSIKVPKPPKQEWFTKKSLKKHSEEFSKKDWVEFKKKDSLTNRYLDSLHKAVWIEN